MLGLMLQPDSFCERAAKCDCGRGSAYSAPPNLLPEFNGERWGAKGAEGKERRIGAGREEKGERKLEVGTESPGPSHTVGLYLLLDGKGAITSKI